MSKAAVKRKPLTPDRDVALLGVPRAVDMHVGARLRMRRILLGISQEKLGDSVGLTF